MALTILRLLVGLQIRQYIWNKNVCCLDTYWYVLLHSDHKFRLTVISKYWYIAQ